jgi:hypothetical protein
VNRIKRPNTWLHRPMLQNVKKALANTEPSTHGTNRRLEVGQSMSALPGNSDINLFCYYQGVIHHDGPSAYVLSNRGKASTLPRFGERQKNDRLNIDGHRKTPDRECGVDIQQAARFSRCFLKSVKP